jgi:single-strand DNA-binding protein
MNKTILHGNLGSDPELKKTDNGMAVANVSLATKEVWTKDGEKVEHTEWHRLVFWGRQAESVAQYAQKGSGMLVDGRLRTREWEKDGVKRYTTEVHVNTWEFAGSKSSDSGASRPSATSSYTPPSAPPIDDDDLPF